MILSERRRTCFICLVIALGTLVLYAPAFKYGFINFDDPEYVVNNAHLAHGFSWAAVKWCFQPGYASNWHPLTWLSHMLDCQWYGLQPGGHHITNVIIHAVNSMLLFLALQRMTKTFWRSAMAAMLFAWHPLRVESVAWISERKDVLSALFWLLTIIAYLRYVERRSKIRYGVVLLLFALGLMVKPMLVTLPFVLLLLDWWPLGRFNSKRGSTQRQIQKDSKREAPSTIRQLILEKLPFVIMAVVCCFLTVIAQRREDSLISLTDYPLGIRWASAVISYFTYIAKTIWPSALSVIYPIRHGILISQFAVACSSLICFSVLVIRFRKTSPYLLVGWLWYLGALVPVIGIVQVGSQSMADRYTYIPSIGLFMMLCWGLYDLCRAWRYHRTLMTLLSSTALLACWIDARGQLQCWENSGVLFAHSLKLDPDNYIARTFYGAFLRDENELEQARSELERVVRDAPYYPLGHVILGQILLSEGDLDGAAAQMRLGVNLRPNQTWARLQLGKVFLAQKLPKLAADELAKALECDPRNYEVRGLLGTALEAQGRFEDAEAQFAEAAQLAPQSAEAHYQLALDFSREEKTGEAVVQYKVAVELDPKFSEALNNLAWILATDPHPEIRNGVEAVELATKACALVPSQPMMIGTLASAYAEVGRFDEAVALAQKASDLALAQGRKQVAAKNLELLKLYRARQAYRQP
ncbi:MAG TPA: tetratricopeptide repeat protein [Candidatus Saccharimonadales bacterium]|nr:tetratricopeptide repeat protein [Candidatus Saccharimonadales bacterium]